MKPSTKVEKIIDQLSQELNKIDIPLPVTHTYNPYIYAKKPFLQYFERYSQKNVPTILVGMNPGPWGMAQTGIPFGEINSVKDWLKLDAPIFQPQKEHPKRPILGYDCPRSEVSGRRLWGWAMDDYKTPNNFFKNFFVINFCPLIFMEESGKNKTPNTLPQSVQTPINELCRKALHDIVDLLQPQSVIGVGKFAAEQCQLALPHFKGKIGSITHPSPANPKANRGWKKIIIEELKALAV